MRLPRALLVLLFLSRAPAVLAQTGPVSPAAPVPPRRLVLPVAISLFERDWSTNTWLALGGNSYEEETRGVLLAGVQVSLLNRI